MLIETYHHALEKKASILEALTKSELQRSLNEAKGQWHEYQPVSTETRKSGIDSSWNLIPYQGFYLYAVDAVSLTDKESFAAPPCYTVDLGTLEIEENNEVVYNPRLRLQSIGMEFEYQLAVGTLADSDFVLIDGSILARFYDRRLRKPLKFYEYASKLMTQTNVLFVAKTSESNLILKGSIGDLYYFSKATSTPGFSVPHFEPIGVTIFYARLSSHTPCIKIEVPGKVDEKEARRILDVLGTNSFNGYPYALRLAHERCKIANDDMVRLAELLGLNTEVPGREVLGE